MITTEFNTIITATAHAGICRSISTIGVTGTGLLLIMVYGERESILMLAHIIV